MNRRQRGFATFMAVGLLGLVAVTLLVLGWHFKAEALRTRRYDAEAQVRQLLLAGEAMARADDLKPLPESLQDATLTIERDGEAYVITATVGRYTGCQRVTYRDTATGRAIESATLEALP